MSRGRQGSGTDETDPQALHDELAATAERPVERSASRWLGEADAIAGDVAHGGMSDDVRRERLEQIEELLGHVDGTGDEQADDHVEAARDLVADLLG